MKVHYFLAVLVIAILLVSCSSGGSNRREVNYRTGSQALELNFFQTDIDAYEGDELALLLEYSNKGIHPITDGEIFLRGYDPAYLNLAFNPSNRFEIEGKSQFDPTGELTQTMTITDSSVRMPENRDIFEQEIQAIACYLYATESSIPVCIDPDPSDRRIGNKVCRGQAVSAGAQGHPVAVTYVEPRVSKNDIRFTIEVANVGNGIIFDKVISNEKCAYDLQYQDTNKIYVRKVSFSDKILDCAPDNPVTIGRSGNGVFACTCTNCINSLDGAYQTTLTVEFDYGYRSSASARVTVHSDDV